MNAEEAAKRPLPRPDVDTRALWAGLAQGQLLLQHCGGCGRVHFHQQMLCRNCGSEDLVHKPASGRGTIYSYTVVHRAPTPAFKSEAPYGVLLVELEEGPRMIANYAGGPADEVTIGMDVQLVVQAITETISLPRFRKA